MIPTLNSTSDQLPSPVGPHGRSGLLPCEGAYKLQLSVYSGASGTMVQVPGHLSAICKACLLLASIAHRTVALRYQVFPLARILASNKRNRSGSIAYTNVLRKTIPASSSPRSPLLISKRRKLSVHDVCKWVSEVGSQLYIC